MTTDNRGLLSDPTRSPVGARQRILQTFNAMLLGRERRPTRIAEFAAKAGVARSTFYDNFRSAGDLELEALSIPLGKLADAAAGTSNAPSAESLLVHFWEYRAEVRKLLDGPQRRQVDRLFERLVAARLPDGANRPLIATQASAALLASIDAWVHGRVIATPVELAAGLAASACALREAN